MPVAITCPLCRAAARVPYEMLGQQVRCPGCLQTILAPSPDELLPTVTLAPPADAAAAPPPTARVLTRSPVGSPVVATDGGRGVVLGLVLGSVGLVVTVGLVAWFVSLESSSGGGSSTVTLAASTPGVPATAQWEDPVVSSEPGASKPTSAGAIVFGPYEPGPLAGPAEKVGPVTVTPVTLPPGSAPGQQVDSLCWSANGSQVFILTGFRQLVRAEMPGLGRSQQLDFTSEAVGLGRSARGLVVTMPAAEEVCVLDPATLEVKTRIGVVGIRRALTAPGLSVAYGLCWSNGPTTVSPGLPPGDVPGLMRALVRIDLDAGTVTLLRAPEGLLPPAGPDAISLSPDGKFLFADAGSQLTRYAIADGAVEQQEQTPSVAGDSGGPAVAVTVSPDGKRVAGPASDGQTVGVSVFEVADLQKPVVKVPWPGWRVGFAADGRLFTADGQSPLVVFDAAGKRLAAHGLGASRSGPDVRQFYPHPSGKGLFVVTTQELRWVDLPAD